MICSIVRTTLIALCLTTTLYPMDITLTSTTPDNTYKQHLIISNKTSWPLLVLYTLKKYTDPVGVSLIPRGEVVLEDPSSMESLKVVPSGKVYGNLQLMEPQDIRAHLGLCLQPGSFAHYQIPITGATEDASLIKKAIQHVWPFTIGAVNEVPHATLLEKLSVPEGKTPMEAFPEVAAALVANRVPFARHYLGISLSSSHIQDPLPSIYEAYQRRHKHWQRHLGTHPKYVNKVLKILEQAQHLLTETLTLRELLGNNNNTLPLTLKYAVTEYIKEAFLKVLKILEQAQHRFTEQLTLRELLGNNNNTLPLTLKRAVTKCINEAFSNAHNTVVEQWNNARIEPALLTKVLEHLRSELTLLENTNDLSIPIEEDAPIPKPKRNSLRGSLQEEELLDLLLDPAFCNPDLK